MTQTSSGAANALQTLEDYWRRQSADAGLGLEPIIDLFSDAIGTVMSLAAGEPGETLVDPLGYAGIQSEPSDLSALFDSSAGSEGLGVQSASAVDNGLAGLSQVTDALNGLGTSLQSAVPPDARGLLIQIFTLIAQAFEQIVNLVTPASGSGDATAADTLGKKPTSDASLFSAFGDEMSSAAQSAAGSIIPFFSPDSSVMQSASLAGPNAHDVGLG